MRATEYVTRQFSTVNQILHDIADDLTADELTARVLPNTNLLAFDLWHVARTQDWAVQTLARGVPEVIDESRWRWQGELASHGIGVGLSEAEADDVARALSLRDILGYADAVHGTILSWLATLSDKDLDAEPDVPAHLPRYPVYLGAAMRKEAPWMFERPPLWRCLGPAVGHNRDHLAEIDLLKRQLRRRGA
ncbi:MAG TPA: DinB family protein [Ktedonobacterales bacterium]|jgi:DinB superfamily|nr:DinB family protein [Ktedonobacterales bacterium]